MHRNRRKVDKASIEWANNLANQRIDCDRELISNVDNDPKRAERLAKQECPICFYVTGRIGGAAVTFAECAFCGTRIMSGNTNIDVMCGECAKAAGLCKHCGADIDLKNRRKRKLPVVVDIVDQWLI